MCSTVQGTRDSAGSGAAVALGFAVFALFVVLALGGCGPKGAELATEQPPVPFDHSRVREPNHQGVAVTSHYVDVEDGTRIAVDVYLPAEGPLDRFPTILQFTPYQRAVVPAVHALSARGRES
jgi:hypothetical protein